MKNPEVSVVVCTRGRPNSLAQTLQSLLGQAHSNFELVVVDQSEDDLTRRLVENLSRIDGRLRYMHLDTPGLSRAYNVGIGASDAPLLAFTDDDCVVPDDWLVAIVTAFAAHPQAFLLYGQVLAPPGAPSDAARGGVTPTLSIPERRVLDRRHGFEVFGMGANFAARRELFDSVGPFDEMLGGGGPLQSSQDFDLLYRAFQRNHSTLLEPDVVVYHHGFRSSTQWPDTLSAYGIGVGGFLTKHVRAGDLLAARLLLGFIARALVRVVRRVITRTPLSDQVAFARGILVGMRRSFAFAVDSNLRLYKAR